MINSRVKDIKQAQKERILLREILQLYHEASMDDSRLKNLIINRVKLSKDKSVCFVYFYTPDGKEEFEKKLEILKLYKPSMRTALANRIKSRYTPDIRFKFDDTYEKQEKIESLLERIKKEEGS